MKIKSLLNLSEATVTLDTVNLEDKLLQDFLKKNDIKFKVINKHGPAGGWPEVEYSGTKSSLEKLIHNYFGDDDLKDLINEDGRVSEPAGKETPRGKEMLTKESNVYVKGHEEAHMVKSVDNTITVYFIDEEKHSKSSKEFPNMNAAMRYLESNGWELRDIKEEKK